jgi:hypothetical protein
MSITDDRVAVVVLKIREVQKQMDESERTELWATIRQGYCPECGKEDPQGECICWRDE